MAGADSGIGGPGGGGLVFRHRLVTRVWHWLNAVALALMLMSGLMIFNAHPRLYWGKAAANDDVAWLEIGASSDAAGALHGGVRIGRMSLETTGVLGVSRGGDGALTPIAFPGWVTIPSTYDLAAARAWHLAFALVLGFGLAGFLVLSLANGHVRRDLHITRADWALAVDGLVKHPLALSMAALQAMRQRVQITRHDCVEGWSAIGKWQGPQLGAVLAMAGLLPAARFVVFHCADRNGDAPYYESIDLVDAFHPQTILAWRMNDRVLPVEHGAPVRLRVERQLGYKQAKYVMRVEVRASLDGLYGGKGGYWEDATGYQWFGGI